MSGMYPGNEFDPDARYAWDHDDPMEEDDVRLAEPEENAAMVTMAEVVADRTDTCPF